MPMTILASVDPKRSRIVARTAHDQPIHMDADPPDGDDSAPGPRETLLAALAGCTSMDVSSILRKKRQQPTSYDVAISAESATEHPRVFTIITVEHRVAGAVEAEALRRSIELSSTRYCPVSAMLSKGTTIEHRYRLVGESGEVEEGLVAITGPEGIHVA